jgi:hypothetical protein
LSWRTPARTIALEYIAEIVSLNPTPRVLFIHTKQSMKYVNKWIQEINRSFIPNQRVVHAFDHENEDGRFYLSARFCDNLEPPFPF